jgi:hypothetical protein
MSYKIISKFSYEISENEWFEIKESFNLIFKKNNSINFFKNKYTDCSLGFSTHGILYFNDKIVGCFTIIPRDYSLFNKKETIGLACDAYILEGFREDELFLRKMSESAISKINDKKITKFISLPNPDAYKYWKYLSNWKDIGELDYFVYPVNFSKLIFKHSFLSFLSLWFSYISSYFFKILYFYSNNTIEKNIFIEFDELSIKQRFNLDSYFHIKLSNKSWGYYRIYKEKGLNVAYIVHVNFLSKRNLSLMINKIIIENGLKIDLIVYVGNLSIKPLNLFKLPKDKYPRRLFFTGLIKDNANDMQNKDFLNLNNWEVNLVNFDNR